MSVRIIPAVTAASQQKIQKTRVAAYCRVSTDNEEQETSYEAQIVHYTSYITSHTAWTLAGIYADEGISGTGTRHRERFNAMIQDCLDGKIDMVITKSISRFARNTLDCLKYIRLLKEHAIPILFEKENINTLDAKGELLITIMASIAQQESQSISQNVRMGHQYRMQQGKPIVNSRFVGYTLSSDKSKLVILPEEAILVRTIYRQFLDGFSISEIAAFLMKEKVPSPSQQEKWYPGCIRSILRNEKYMGDLLLQKYYVKDFLSKTRVRNNGALPKYYVADAHDPIIPKDIFMKVQGEFLRRESGKPEVHRRNTILYHKVYCGKCNSFYHRYANGNTAAPDWRCAHRSRNTHTCAARIIKEESLLKAIQLAFQRISIYSDDLKKQLQSNDDLDHKIIELQMKEDSIHTTISTYVETGRINVNGQNDEETNKELNILKNEVSALKDQKKKYMREKAEIDAHQSRMRDLLQLIEEMEEEPDQNWKPDTFNEYIQRQLKQFPPECTEAADFYQRTNITSHKGPITTLQDEDVRRYIEKIIVYEKSMCFLFRAGIKISIQI